MQEAVIVSVELPVPRQDAWDEIAQLEHHVEWMSDAYRIEFLTPRRAGPGTRMRVETRIGPLRTSDIMEITAWEPPARMAVVHTGLFTGEGEFVLEPAGPSSTRFTWSERIRFPWYFAGRLGALAVRPVFRLVWKRNLARLRERLSSR